MQMKKTNLADMDSVDPSDPDGRLFAGAIDAHSRLADFYKYRPPYSEVFFRELSGKLGLSRESVMLDLCCGRGELASKLASYCGGVFAVDGSAEMLKRRIVTKNVLYLKHDVNAESLALPGPVDHIAIGSAIHWIRLDSLRNIIRSHLKPGGKVLISHTMLKIDDQPYAMAASRVNEEYGQRSRSIDIWGTDKLAGCAYRAIDGLRVLSPVKFDTDTYYKIQTSYLYQDFFQRVTAEPESYRTRLHDALSPFLKDGKLSGTVVNWGVIYSADE